MKRLLILAASGLALASCDRSAPAPPSAGAVAFDTSSLDMAEFMGHIVDPAAFAYWRGSGTEITMEGERDLAPTTDEGWLELENGAATLIEAGNILQMQGRAREPTADWNRYAQLLTSRAVIAMAAAENKDKQAVFDTGGKVFEACVACHEKFVIGPIVQSQGPPKGVLLPWPADVAGKPK